MLEVLIGLFGSVREPVLIEQGGQIVYRNTAALLVDVMLTLPDEFLAHKVPFVGSVNIGGENYQVTVSAAGEYRVFFLYRSQTDNRALFISAGNSIKNSVMTIQMVANMMDGPGTVGLSEDNRSILYHQLHSINRIAGNLLYLGGAEVSGEKEMLDLVTLYEDLVHTVNVLVNGTRAKVEFNSSEDSIDFAGSGMLLERMLLNLLSNSLKATPKDGKVTVTIGKHGNRAIIKVSDNGKGVPKEILPKLFSSYDVERDLSETYKSVGMGLAVVRGIVGSLDGTVIAVSDENRGTTVTVSLPLNREKDNVLHSYTSDYGTKDMSLLQTELSDVLDTDCYSEKFRD